MITYDSTLSVDPLLIDLLTGFVRHDNDTSIADVSRSAGIGSSGHVSMRNFFISLSSSVGSKVLNFLLDVTGIDLRIH